MIAEGAPLLPWQLLLRHPLLSLAWLTFEVFGGYEHLMLHRAGQRYAPGDLALVGSRIQF